MGEDQKSRWQSEFDALPEWVKPMVMACQSLVAHGMSESGEIFAGMSKDSRKGKAAFFAAMNRNDAYQFMTGFWHMSDLAKALTAPWPPAAAPAREKRAFNVVELMDEQQAFDQPCAFGNRCGGHAVYCHHETWPHSPRKCRRNRTDHRHEDCPGFVANPDYKQAPADEVGEQVRRRAAP